MIYSENSDGFKFAIIAMTAVLAILIKILEIVQHTAVEVKTYIFSIALITFLLYSFILLLLYIIFKGLSMESRNIDRKNNLDKLASEIYKSAFLLITLMIVVILLSIFMEVYNYADIVNQFIFLVFLLFLYSIYLYVDKNYKAQESILYIKSMKKENKLVFIKNLYIKYPKWFRFIIFISPSFNNCKKIYINLVIFAYSILIISILFFIPYILLMGDATINMENLYYKNETIIPVSIQETGLITNQSIKLLHVDSDDNLILIDQISIKPEDTSNNIESGENSTLIGVALGHGNYNIFIKTTNLNEGYYLLECSGDKKCFSLTSCM